MWRSLARFCSALFALSVLASLVLHAGCGKGNKDTSLPETKTSPISQPASEPQAAPVTPEPAFFPGTKAGPIFPKPSSTPTSQKKNSKNNSNDLDMPVLPPSKSGKIFTPNQP